VVTAGRTVGRRARACAFVVFALAAVAPAQRLPITRFAA
jgi:hypothetical protein